MARKKLSEFTAKTILSQILQLPYTGISINITDKVPFASLKDLSPKQSYVVKVDQGVKQRMKKGLVFLDVARNDIEEVIETLARKGYTQFLVEQYIPHTSSQERYLALERIREGIKVYIAPQGGIDIEEQKAAIKTYIYTSAKKENVRIAQTIQKEVGLSQDILQKLIKTFEEQYFSFLEINPFIFHRSSLIILDLAVEIDSAASFFVTSWTEQDIVDENPLGTTTEEEKNIAALSNKSQASFKLNVLNPNGSIFMLLSGGGASIVLADEVGNLGYGKELANYGEYSGNPNKEETYIYTKNILSLLVRSKAKKKVLIIGGGAANFTDIRITFRGVVQALEDYKEKLKKEQVRIYVRRGGPNQEEGLQYMKESLKKHSLFGGVWNTTLILTDVVKESLVFLKRK